MGAEEIDRYFLALRDAAQKARHLDYDFVLEGERQKILTEMRRLVGKLRGLSQTLKPA